MDSQDKKILTLYRKHIMSRLEYAYADGSIDSGQYGELYDELVNAKQFNGLRRVVVGLRHASGAPHGWRARLVPSRRQRQLRNQRRWWKPERMWVIGVAAAVMLGLLVLFGLVATTEWITSS